MSMRCCVGGEWGFFSFCLIRLRWCVFAGVQKVYKMPVQVAVFSISIWLSSFFMVSGFSLVLRHMFRMWPDLLKLECSIYLSCFMVSRVSLCVIGSTGVDQL